MREASFFKIIASKELISFSGLESRIVTGSEYQNQTVESGERDTDFVVVCDEKGCLSKIPSSWCVEAEDIESDDDCEPCPGCMIRGCNGECMGDGLMGG